MSKTKTHFERVPLQQIEHLRQGKKKAEPPRKKAAVGNVTVERPKVKTEPYSVGRSV